MSRMGRRPVLLPQGVQVQVQDGSLKVQGPKGHLLLQLPAELELSVGSGEIRVVRKNETSLARSLHGLYRTQLCNMVKGVIDGFSKTLEVEGVGYRAQVTGNKLVLQLGLSHPIEFSIPSDIKITVDKQTIITVQGADKVHVGQVAAQIRFLKPPEPYKGTGIHYQGEQILRKAGKTAGGAGSSTAWGGGGKK